MNSITAYALLSDQVYARHEVTNPSPTSGNNQPLTPSDLVIPGATFVRKLDDPTSGFYAEAWTINGKLVVAFRGTDFGLAGVLNIGGVDFTSGNIPLAHGSAQAAQWMQAKAFVVNA
jgi:hypothetical protein